MRVNRKSGGFRQGRRWWEGGAPRDQNPQFWCSILFRASQVIYIIELFVWHSVFEPNEKFQMSKHVCCYLPLNFFPSLDISLLGRNKWMTKRSRSPKTKARNYRNQILLLMDLKTGLSQSHPRRHSFEIQSWIQLEITSKMASFLDQESEDGFH